MMMMTATWLVTEPVLKGAPQDQEECGGHLEGRSCAGPRTPTGPGKGLAVVPKL